MSLIRSRNSLITVRLSEEEHRLLKIACEDKGARSISDFVRAIIVQRISSRRSGGVHLAGDLESIAEKLESLDTALNDLSGQITEVLGHRTRREDSKWQGEKNTWKALS